jgi:hypothetical protein
MGSEGDISNHGFKTAALCQEETLAGWSLDFRFVPIPVIDETFEYEGYVIVLLQATTGRP